MTSGIDIAALVARIDRDAIGICARLRDAGWRGWIVGGCVRDLLRGQSVSDWDIATDARPDAVSKLFPRVIPTGIEHGTVTVLVRNVPFEVTTLRGETTYSDGRRPDSVVFVDDITADLARRDFTFNAIAIDPLVPMLIDPWEGQKDLAVGVLRAVGDPVQRFSEDGLRVLRAARFAATLECSIEPRTLAAIEPTLATYRKVSAERVRDEWVKTMKAKKPSTAFEVMRTTGILGVTMPEMLESVGMEQNKHHAYDVWTHALACLDACQGDPPLRIAALLHDIGKPRTRARSDKTQDYTFYNHEKVGAQMAGPILERLRFSNDEKARITSLIANHLVCYSDEWSDAAVRRWIRRVSVDRVTDLYALNRADLIGKGRDVAQDLVGLERLKERVAGELAARHALSARDLVVNGQDVMRELEIKPSRRVGELLESLLEKVVDDPSLNERETLLRLIRESR
ncbi:MAG TPA: HDIG domain-containing protein [Polyangiaceae bacterium]|nr:HDIG domain-containing protein [Polyangiaceae bacterium]